MDCIPDDRRCDDQGDITFPVPEHVACEINELAKEEEHTWTWFAPVLVAKLNQLCWNIV